MLYFTTKQFPNIGNIFFISDGFKLKKLALEGQKNFPVKLLEKATLNNSCAVLGTAITELSEYLAGTRKTFSAFYELEGTKFEQQVWRALLNVEYGSTKSYQDIAILINSPKAVRAAASAIAKNPLLFIIPCHRIIGKNGKLTGFAAGLDLKHMLLNHEQNLTHQV
jgi:O-6-methylguanine DNA methyltransferase